MILSRHLITTSVYRTLILTLAHSFSWSQALQLPLLDLCKDTGKLRLEEMSQLYIEELATASAASKGEHEWKNDEGDHIGTEHVSKKPRVAP